VKKYRILEKTWQNKTAWKLVNENWTLCHEIVDLRDGHVCQIPGCGETENLDLDHVISRGCKITFLDTDILGYLCKTHHSHKSKRKGQWVDLMVQQICRRRIGDDRYEDYIFKSKQCCGSFRSVVFQEQQNMKLKEELAELLGNREENKGVTHEKR